MTALRVTALALIAATMLASTAAARSEARRAAPAAEAAARAAIVDAVRARLGVAAEIGIDRLWLPNLPETAAALTAIAEPGARVGRPISFRLVAAAQETPGGQSVRYGSALASLTVRVPHARLVAPLRPGDVVASGEAAESVDVVSGVRLQRLPLSSEVAGARARQAIPAGAVVEEWMLEREPLVRSGDLVGVRTVVDGVEARTMAKAGERGALGSVIRLVNLQSGRSLRGRVVAKGEVEVVP
jgi:flagella basal body P-ring formation protein FlgA